MVAVNVGDQNQVTLRSLREAHRFRGIEIDRLSSRFDQRAGVGKRRDLDRAGGCGKGLRLGRRIHEWRENQKRADETWQQFHDLMINPVMSCVGRTLLSADFDLDLGVNSRAFEPLHDHRFDPLSGPHFSQRTREMGHPLFHPLFLPQNLHAIAVRGSFQYLELFLDFYDE